MASSLQLIPSEEQATRNSVTRSQSALSNGYEEQFAEISQVHRAQLDFVEDTPFQVFIGAIIGANFLAIAGEVDHPGWIGWNVFNKMFLVIFTLEIILRIAHRGHMFYFFGPEKWWAYLDTTTVVMGMTDMFLQNFMLSSGTSFKMLKALRLFRLVRMVRLIRLFPPIQRFVSALAGMFGSMSWIFMVLLIVMIACAIILTTLIGHGIEAGVADFSITDNPDSFDYAGASAFSQANFKDVPTSLFTLFLVITQDNWRRVADPLLVLNPFWEIFFIVFIIFASWTIISVLTAVASDSMVSATSDRKEEELKAQMARAAAFITFLRDSFYAADSDGNGYLDKEEFETMMSKELVLSEMQRLGFKMSKQELLKVWDTLDFEGCGELTIDDFVSGLSYLQEELCTRHVVGLSYALQRVSHRIQRKMDSILEELECLRKSQSTVLQSLANQEALIEEQDLYLQLWKEWIANHDPKALRPQAIAAAG